MKASQYELLRRLVVLSQQADKERLQLEAMQETVSQATKLVLKRVENGLYQVASEEGTVIVQVFADGVSVIGVAVPVPQMSDLFQGNRASVSAQVSEDDDFLDMERSAQLGKLD